CARVSVPIRTGRTLATAMEVSRSRAEGGATGGGGSGAGGASATRRGGLASDGCGARAINAGLRVTLVDALANAALSNDCILALRSRAVSPPKTAATTCLPSRRTDDTRLKPEARV